MDDDRKVAKDFSKNEGRPGLWAVLSVIFGLLIGGRAIAALIKSELAIPFIGKVVQAQQPVAFYCAVSGLAALAILALFGGTFTGRNGAQRRMQSSLAGKCCGHAPPPGSPPIPDRALPASRPP